MKQVQDALAGIGIPVLAGVWRPTTENPHPPDHYAVYSTTTTESSHYDDRVASYRTYVYLNLWSDSDPTDMASIIREAMYAAGFYMVEQTDNGYNQPEYSTEAKRYTVQWTWCLHEEAEEYVG